MSLSDIVSITISANSPGVTQAGFGKPLILSANAAWVERTRTYTDLAGVLVDFAATTPEYLGAAVIFAQSPCPEAIMIGKCTLKPTQVFTIGVTTVENNKAYNVYVNGTLVTYTSDGSATNDEIATGLALAIDGAQATHTGAATGSALSKVCTVTADAAGNWMSLSLPLVDTTMVGYLSLTQSHVDPGAATDLANILAEDDSWYVILSAYNSPAMVNAIADWANSNSKLYLADLQGSACETHVLSGATDEAAVLKSDAAGYAAGFYHRDNGAFLAYGVAGRCLPLTAGSENWKFKTITGVPVCQFTATQRANLKAKYCNYYYSTNGKSITTEGQVGSGQWIDTVRFLDWFKARTSEAIFARQVGSDEKIPMDDDGIAIIENEVRGVIKEGITAGGISKSPKPIVTAPLAADISAANKLIRNLPGVKFTFTLSGAINKVTVTGTAVA